MHRNCDLHIKENNAISCDKDNLSTRLKRGNQFQRELLLKHPSKSKGKKNEPNCDHAKDSKQCHINTTDKALLFSSDECGKNEPVVATLSDIVTLEEKFEPNKSEKSKNKGVRRMKHDLLSFLDEKKKRWNNFIKAKKRKSGFSSEVHGDGAVAARFGRGRRRRRKRRRRVSLWWLVRIPSRILVIRFKLKMIKSLMMKKKVIQQCEQGGDEQGVSELCRKRILMGARCKPLSSSGTLRYDQDGLHLPEIVP